MNQQHETEAFLLVWLDTRTPNAIKAEESESDIAKRQSELETIINFTRTFADPQDCRSFIESCKSEKIFLIVCGIMAENLIKIVHKLQQVEVIYIFCREKSKHTNWTTSYYKVHGICTTTTELLTVLSRDVSLHAKNLTPLSIFSTDISKEVSLRSLNNDEVRFMWFYLLLELLLRFPSNDDARDDMKKECEQAYIGNSIELHRINEFFRRYTPDNAIRWYTEDSFIYRLLNKAFRTENIDLIFKFRFFIVDLYRQLQKHQQPFTGTLWRGQMMPPNELQLLKNSNGKLISVNTFFSTTESSHHAIEFSGDGSGLPRLESVLFQIDVNTDINDTQPFAKITELSSKPHEKEILFAMNTIFRLEDVEQWDNTWVVHLTLINNNEQSLRPLIDCLKKEMDEFQLPPMLMLGEFLWKMGEFDRANNYYHAMLKELPPNHELIGKLYNNVALIALEKGDRRTAKKYFDKALKLQEPTETLDLAETYSNISVLHDTLDEYEQASDFAERSLKIRLSLLPHDHALVAISYNNLGFAHFHVRNFEKAREYYEKTRAIEAKTLGSSHHYDYATTLSNIGLLHFEEGDYQRALIYHQDALAIQERSLPKQHSQFAESYSNIATTYEQLDQLDEAMIMFQKALQIRLAALLPKHSDIAESYNNLANVLDKLGKHDEALTNYMKVLKYLNTTDSTGLRTRATYLNNIGEHFSDQENFTEATKYHQEALRIRLKLFPHKNHPDVAMSYNNIGLLFFYQNKFDKALRYHFKALAIRRQIHKPDDSRLAISLSNIAMVYLEKSEYQTALDYLRRTLDIQLRSLPERHRHITETIELIDLTTEKLNSKN